VAKNKCISVAGHFEGHASALEQYRRHPPMQHVQGYPGSYWMPSSGNYSLHIAPAAAMAAATKMMTKTYTYFAGHFDGHSNAPVRYREHCQMEKVQGFTRSH
jgi:hypothetical protein